jgi:hypothetical protein
LPVLIVLAALWFGFDFWLGAEPDLPWTDYLKPLLGLGLMLGLWAGFWALLTQLFQRRFPFLLHLQRSLVVLLGATVLEEGLTALAFVASAPALQTLAAWLPPVALAGLTMWQGQLALPRRQGWVRALALAGLSLWAALSWVSEEGAQHRWRSPYMATLLPPAWRAAPLQSVDVLIDQAAQLEAELAIKAKRDPKGRADDPETPD